MPDPKRGVAFTFTVGLVDTAARPFFRANPTLATNDVKLSKDNGALANLATLPVVAPASARLVQVDLSATEMTADRVDVKFVDVAGAEWDEVIITIDTTPGPRRGIAFTFTVGLVDTANRPQFRVNPTLATGDVKLSKDNGALTNLTTLPTVAPAAGRLVQVSLSAAEMTADRIDVQFVDVAGAEWDEVLVTLQDSTTARGDGTGMFRHVTYRG